MAHRILILVGDRAVHAIDARNGRSHAAGLVDTLLADMVQRGVVATADDATVIEVEPEQGGDAIGEQTLQQMHRLRAQWHQLPDGTRELVGIARLPPHGIVHRVTREQRAAGILPDTPEQAAEKLARQRMAVPDPIRGGIRVLRAPPDVATPRRELSPGPSRLEPPGADAGGKRLDPRTARRLATARDRA